MAREFQKVCLNATKKIEIKRKNKKTCHTVQHNLYVFGSSWEEKLSSSNTFALSIITKSLSIFLDRELCILSRTKNVKILECVNNANKS